MTNIRAARARRRPDDDAITVPVIDPPTVASVLPYPGYDHDVTDPHDDDGLETIIDAGCDIDPPPVEPPPPPVPEPLTYAEYTAVMGEATAGMTTINADRAAVDAATAELDGKAADDVSVADLDRRTDLKRETLRIDLEELSILRRLAAIHPGPAMIEAQRREQAATEAVPAARAKVIGDMQSIGWPIGVPDAYPGGSKIPALLNGIINAHPAVRKAEADANGARLARNTLVPHTAGLDARIADLEQRIRKAAGVGA